MSLKNWKIKLAFDGSLHCAGFWQQIMGFLGNFDATHTVEKLKISFKNCAKNQSEMDQNYLNASKMRVKCIKNEGKMKQNEGKM